MPGVRGVAFAQRNLLSDDAPDRPLATMEGRAADAELMIRLKRGSAGVRHVKPAASRQDSSERYVLATGFRGDVKSSIS